MATTTAIKGNKAGSATSRTPVEQPDDLQSVAKAKILIALGEGELAGELTAQTIFLDGTPLANQDGSSNFSGVHWEFRSGTQSQNYIQGMPGTENEVSVGSEIKSDVAWTHTFTNTQLSAVRLRIKWPSLFQQTEDGDLSGYSIKYVIELQTNGGKFVTAIESAVTGKTTSGYERSHRINLPQDGSTWTVRLRKITDDAHSAMVGDMMTLESYTEVIDAKLCYPNTALLYIEFDSSLFNGSVPQISCQPYGRIIRVPSNYNPTQRAYSGIWDGTFKWSWSDNPAWIYYDIVISNRFGLGDRLTPENVDKWELYRVAQYCDQLIPDGKGGDGKEPRHICDVYVQERNEAFTVLRDFAAMFRGMTYWSGNQLVTMADMPRDIDFLYTRANVINGLFTYSSSTTKTRYTTALVSWTDPDNGYSSAMEPVFEKELVSRFGFNQLEITAIGCNRQSEANRSGRWGILTNNKDRVVTFDVGLDGNIPQPGYIIAIADALISGRVTGGRIAAVNGRVITLDREPDAVAGDRLQLNLPSGVAQARTIQAVKKNVITVSTAFSETPEAECVWAVESDELYLQQYRVTGVKDNNDSTFTITGLMYDPDKFERIDNGAVIDERPVSVIPASTQLKPAHIRIEATSLVNQGINVQTMHVSWDSTANAISYEAQWRKNDGNWISVPRTSTTSFDVSGIYSGQYIVRVRAINAVEISSSWGYSEETGLKGKDGNPPKPVGFMASGINWGVRLTWGFPANTGDTLSTEIQYTANADYSSPLLLSDVPYPSKEYIQLGLKAGQAFWYRAQLVDKIGNESGYTGWISGAASGDADDYLGDLTKDFLTSKDGGRLTDDIQTSIGAILQNALNLDSSISHQFRQVGEVRADVLTVKTTVAEVDKALAEMATQVQAQIGDVTSVLEDKLTAVVNGDGASAIYSLKTGVRINGVMYNAGMSVAVLAEPGKPVVTRIGFNANQFVLMSGSGNAQFSPFAVVDGQVFISDAFIQNGTITSAKIADATITNAKISGDIQSDGFSSNNGWQISKSRNTMTFNSASTGVFINATGFGYQENGVVLCKMGQKP
ncbi:host specificity protein J [Pantoea coffeiphila]|uniref:Host specificity protein n=1 Tax=Pantoea coffeiphila TaxID=1465635 RepID=A0A2S9I8F5_9GAMM|nr:host specificity protein J [Pantoea coffeiphila]PRD14061.1 host specificity protein [Pantoea coffeiphila]